MDGDGFGVGIRQKEWNTDDTDSADDRRVIFLLNGDGRFLFLLLTFSF
jgi:hypothetical protein